MKTFLTKSKSSSFMMLLALGLASSLTLWAKPVAQVTEVRGQVFVVTPDGKTKMLKLNDHLEEKSEVMVEEDGAITLNDFYDATYHLIGGGHLKFFNKSVQLKRGKTWIQSQNARHGLALTTANGHVNFWKAEFITTFDQASSRSQILVVNGDAEVSNVLNKNMKFTIPAGSFTIVDPEVENGSPRSPTRVGLASLNSALSEFKQLPDRMKDAQTSDTPSRGIASVSDVTAAKKGEIIFMTSNRLPASVKGGAHSYFKQKTKISNQKLTHAPIKFYGIKTISERSPASIPIKFSVSQNASEKVNLDQEFSESLKKQVQEQPKYPKELESLIQDLKSY